MLWFFKHKLLILLIIAGIVYWTKNPEDRIGFSRPGFVVFNKIPIAFFDCYISPGGKIHLESDLSKKENINYWIENHLSLEDTKSFSTFRLLVGTGFKGTKDVVLTPEQSRRLRERKIVPVFFPSPEAIVKFNQVRDDSVSIGLLLKIN